MAIYTSVVLWLATIAGNVVLFSVRPAHHWALLETLETLQVASLVPIALLFYKLNRRSTTNVLISAIGLGAMLTGTLIDLGFVTGAVTYGQGLIGGPGFYAFELTVILWLLAANALAWRIGSLPRRLAQLGVATAVTATLLYPVWAVKLARALEPNKEHER